MSNTARREHYIGLMSGTSLDGVDSVLAEFSGRIPRVVAASHITYDDVLRADLLALSASGSDELHRAALLARQLSAHYAEAVHAVLRSTGLGAADIGAIGCHGQTVRHRPDLGYTLQLANPAQLAESTGITVVADLRSRDIAAGGQGAPLVPAFHRAVFAHPDRHVVVANIGGIANLTSIAPGKPVTGFDCGPGNMLMDAWIHASRGERLDRNGEWALSGKLIAELLDAMMREPFLRQAPPKSTGRDLFGSDWLAGKLRAEYQAADVQRSLLEFTAESLALALESWCMGAQELVLCGGGARNAALRARLTERLPALRIGVSDDKGIAAEHVEALAFSWLARRTMRGEPGNIPEVTGAAGARILGAIYPA